MQVVIQNLTKRFGTTTALQQVSLSIASQELFFLLGPSGCGKTTLLRLIAGFYDADGGQIYFGNKPMQGVPPHRRNTGMVFQNYALWPHMTVAENVAYGLSARSIPAAERKKRVHAALEIVQMEKFASRSPNQLSGGQQQRVAVARALVISPDVLLLDEPLSNLDAKLRLEMRDEIRRIHQQTRITTIYVTHDQKEALSLATRMAILRDGVVEQLGAPRGIYRTPASRFVADFIGETNWLPAKVVASTASGIQLETAFGQFSVEARAGFCAGQTVDLGFRPEAVQFGVGRANNLAGTIQSVSYLGEVEQYQLQLSEDRFIKAIEQNPIENRAVGTSVSVNVRPGDCILFPSNPSAYHDVQLVGSDS
jgi:iron(III) transport system ATP-binding protein